MTPREKLLELFQWFSGPILRREVNKNIVNECFLAITQKQYIMDILLPKNNEDFVSIGFADSPHELETLIDNCKFDGEVKRAVIAVGSYNATLIKCYQSKDEGHPIPSGANTWHYHLIFHLF